MAVDIPRRILKNRKIHRRTEVKSPNHQLKLLSDLYEFLARRTDSKFNDVIARRLKFSKRNKHPLSISRLSRIMKKDVRQGKVAVCVGTITNDERLDDSDIPKMTVCALRFSEGARKRIIAAGGECLTFDQLALRDPKCENIALLRGPISHREAEKHFGPAPGLPGSHTKPYHNPKYSH